MTGTLSGAVQRAHVPGVVLGLAGTAAVLGAIAGLDDPALLPVLVVALALGAAFVVPAVAALVVLPVGVLGGLLMGIGARLSFGCNVGAFLGGTASGSLHGFVWIAAAIAGAWFGLRLRPFFGFPASRR